MLVQIGLWQDYEVNGYLEINLFFVWVVFFLSLLVFVLVFSYFSLDFLLVTSPDRPTHWLLLWSSTGTDTMQTLPHILVLPLPISITLLRDILRWVLALWGLACISSALHSGQVCPKDLTTPHQLEVRLPHSGAKTPLRESFTSLIFPYLLQFLKGCKGWNFSPLHSRDSLTPYPWVRLHIVYNKMAYRMT